MPFAHSRAVSETGWLGIEMWDCYCLRDNSSPTHQCYSGSFDCCSWAVTPCFGSKYVPGCVFSHTLKWPFLTYCTFFCNFWVWIEILKCDHSNESYWEVRSWILNCYCPFKLKLQRTVNSFHVLPSSNIKLNVDVFFQATVCLAESRGIWALCSNTHLGIFEIS